MEINIDEFSRVSDIGKIIKEMIDTYYARTISRTNIKKEIQRIIAVEKNRRLVFRGDEFRATFLHTLGKKRLNTLAILLKEIDPERYGTLL